jgi:hypothetical protein
VKSVRAKWEFVGIRHVSSEMSGEWKNGSEMTGRPSAELHHSVAYDRYDNGRVNRHHILFPRALPKFGERCPGNGTAPATSLSEIGAVNAERGYADEWRSSG